MAKKRITQAVIVIHGIGEQKPMSTLRTFVDAVLPPVATGEEKYFSKPDQMSEQFELRKLQNRAQPRTHFFEYYWADKVQGTTFTHVRNWFSSLLFRSPRRIPRQLILLWVLTWLLILLIVTLAATGVMDNYFKLTESLKSIWVLIFGTGVLCAVQLVVIQYIGDAG